MNIPVVFRIYAVINLLAFVAFGILSSVLTVAGNKFGVFAVALHWTLTLWLLIAAIAWFFANKNAYHFLISLTMLFLMLIGLYNYIVFMTDIPVGSDSMMFLIIAGCCFIYTIFLVVAAFYKPVIEWTASRMNFRHHSMMLLLLMFVAAGFSGFGTLWRKSLPIEISYDYSSNAAYENVPEWINGNEWIKMEFYGRVELNSLSIPVDAASQGQKMFYAKMFYADSANFDYRLAPSIVLTFKDKGDQMVADFTPIKARVIQLFPMENETTSAAATSTYNIASLTPLWSYGYFDKTTPDVEYDNSPAATYGTYTEYEEGYVDDGTPEGNGRQLTEETLPDLYSTFLTNSSFFNSEWMFNMEGSTLSYSDGESSRSIGMFQQGVGNLFFCVGSAVKEFRAYSGYDYDMFIGELSGLPLYLSRARGYDYAGNGTEFNYLNPAVISWAEKNLLLNKNTVLLGHSVQQYYDVVFKRFARMMVYSRDYLERQPAGDELKAYVEASEKEGFYGPTYLAERFKDVGLDDYYQDLNWKEAADFIGFWLRREQDGSYDECSKALNTIINSYDKAWFDEYTLLMEESKKDAEEFDNKN